MRGERREEGGVRSNEYGSTFKKKDKSNKEKGDRREDRKERREGIDDKMP